MLQHKILHETFQSATTISTLSSLYLQTDDEPSIPHHAIHFRTRDTRHLRAQSKRNCPGRFVQLLYLFIDHIDRLVEQLHEILRLTGCGYAHSQHWFKNCRGGIYFFKRDSVNAGSSVDLDVFPGTPCVHAFVVLTEVDHVILQQARGYLWRGIQHWRKIWYV